MDGLRIAILPLLLFLYDKRPHAGLFHLTVPPQSQNKSAEAERNRTYLRQEFQKNFKNLQEIGKTLLQEHEAARLTPAGLSKHVKSIQKCAKTLRSLLGLGAMARPTEINKEIDTPREFDNSIRKLVQLIRTFAHNPVHQNSKVFNTDQAEQAQTDLLAIILLSRALENRSKSYLPSPIVENPIKPL